MEIPMKTALFLLLLAASLATVTACGSTARSTNLHPVAGTHQGNEMFKDGDSSDSVGR
jgi:hypothetical protein